MISLKDAITGLDHNARFKRKCLALWRGSLRAVETYMFPLFPESGRKVEDDWHQVHKCLEEDAPDEVLDSTPRLIERVLHNYAQNARRTQREYLDSVKDVLETMATAAQSVRDRTSGCSTTLMEVSETLAVLVQVKDSDELREQLSRHSAGLRARVATLVQESETALTKMESDLAQFRGRLAEAETTACTDPLTGLTNRREVERQMERRIRLRRQFCTLMLDLDGFKSVNDRFGHACGDQVLQGVGKLLSELVRPGDVVARWGGDEYVILLDCNLRDAMRRTEQIAARLARQYQIEWRGETLQIPVRASAGVVEWSYGETSAEVFRRADEAMYAAKWARRTRAVKEAETG